MATFWHLLHLGAWIGCIGFLFSSETNSDSPGLYLEQPELLIEGGGQQWSVESGKGFLNPGSFRELSLLDEVTMEYQGQKCSASEMKWDLISGKLSLREPVIEGDLGIDFTSLEFTPENKGYEMTQVETSLSIPIDAQRKFPLRVERLTLPMGAVGKLIGVGPILRKPMESEGGMKNESPLEKTVEESDVWDLNSQTLGITQSRFFIRARFKGLKLSKGDDVIRADSALAKWGPLRWVLKDGLFSSGNTRKTFKTGVLFLEEGRVILDREEFPVP